MSETYELSVKFSLLTAGFAMGATEVMNGFNRIKTQAAQAETAIGSIERRMQTSASTAQRYAEQVSVGQRAQAAAFNDMQRALAANDPTGLATAHNQRLAAIDATAVAQGKLNVASGAYTTLASEQQRALTQQAAAQERATRAQTGFNAVLAGATMTTAGVGIMGFLDKSVNQAMALQTIMIGIGNRTGAKPAQLAALQNRFADVGMTNQMNVTEVAQIGQAANQAGITDFGQLMGMIKPIANFSEVMLASRQLAPQESATVAMQFAHLFGAFGTQNVRDPQTHQMMSDTQYLVNQLGKALSISPGSPKEFLTLESQFVGTMRPMYRGKPQQTFISDAINYGVLMSQMGQETRGGTQLSRLLVQAMGAGSRTSKAGRQDLATIQQVSHTPFVNAQGQITDPIKLMQGLTRFAADKRVTPQLEGRYFQQVFKQAGASIAGQLADPIVAGRFSQIAGKMQTLPTNAQQQAEYNASGPGQLRQAQKNWETFTTLLGTQLIPVATQMFNVLAKIAGAFASFAEHHKTLTAIVAGFAAITGAVFLIAGPILMIAGGLMMMGAAIPILSGIAAGIVGLTVAAVTAIPAFAGLDIVLSPILITVLAIAAAVGAVIFVFTHWSDITRLVGDLMGVLGDKLHQFLVWAGLLDTSKKVVHSNSGLTVDQANTYNKAHPYAAPILPNQNGHWRSFRGGATWVPDPPAHRPPTKGKGGGGAIWDMPDSGPSARAAHGAAPVVHTGPVTIGPIHINGVKHEDDEALAHRLTQYIARHFGDEVLHALTSGAPSVFGLSPVLNTPAPR